MIDECPMHFEDIESQCAGCSYKIDDKTECFWSPRYKIEHEKDEYWVEENLKIIHFFDDALSASVFLFDYVWLKHLFIKSLNWLAFLRLFASLLWSFILCCGWAILFAYILFVLFNVDLVLD